MKASQFTLIAQMVNLPSEQETQVRSMGQENPLKKGMATYSSILAWTIPWTEEPGGLQPMGLQSQMRLSTRARVYKTGGKIESRW